MSHVVRPRAICLALFTLAIVTAACSDGGGPAAVPKAIEAATTTLPSAEAGSALLSPPTFVVRDASGKALGGIAVTIAVGAVD